MPGRRPRRVCLAVALALLLVTVGASSAGARPVAAPAPVSVAAAPPRTSVVATAVCGALSKPVSVGVSRIISLLTEGRVRGTLAGQLFTQVGFTPWCKNQFGKLVLRLRRVAAQRPDLRSRLGPFVYGVYASYTRWNAFKDQMFVHRSEFAGSSRLRNDYTWYSLNGGTWQPLGAHSLLVPIGDRVKFAARVDDTSGLSSPWAYSVTYRAP